MTDHPPGEPVRITPKGLDVYRDWVYPCGSFPAGAPVVFELPENFDEMESVNQRYEPEEEAVGVMVLAVEPAGTVTWVSHVVGQDMGREEFVRQHGAEIVRQALGCLFKGKGDMPPPPAGRMPTMTSDQQPGTTPVPHPETARLLRYFTHEHLPEHLQGVSAVCTQTAQRMDELLPDGPEKTAGLRKLLEAKDCFVRAALDQ